MRGKSHLPSPSFTASSFSLSEYQEPPQLLPTQTIIDIAEIFLTDEKPFGSAVAESLFFADLDSMVRRHLSL
jgi:hypothetical protein